MQTCRAGVGWARIPYFHILLRVLPRVGHHFFALLAEAPYEQAGPEIHAIVLKKE